MDISTFIRQGKLRQAIEVIVSRNGDEGLLLMARYNSLERQNNRGVLTANEYNTKTNQITAAALSFAGDMPATSVRRSVHNADFNESELLQIVKENKRLRPEIAEEARVILKKYRNWKDTKSERATFDPNGRKLKRIKALADAMVLRLRNQKEDDLEQIIDRIEKLLSEPIPSWESLKEAYVLASGRGFSSDYVVRQLELKPRDNNVKVAIADEIEDFTTIIQL